MKQHIRYYLYLILFILLNSGCVDKSEKKKKITSTSFTKDDIREIASLIAQDNVLKSFAVGVVGERTSQWERFEELRIKATDSQLVALTNYENPVVRCYAFQAILERKSIKTFPLVVSHLFDSTKLQTISGCIGRSEKVGDYYLENFFLSNEHSVPDKSFETEMNVIDSLLIAHRNFQSEYGKTILNKLSKSSENYKWLREMAVSEKNKDAVVIIAKYHKKEDRILIKQLLNDPDRNANYYGLKAVINYPDPSFYPALEKIVKDELTGVQNINDNNIEVLYKAIVQYKTERTRKLLDDVLNQKDQKKLIAHSDFIYQAVNQYPDKIYHGLRYRHTYF